MDDYAYASPNTPSFSADLPPPDILGNNSGGGDDYKAQEAGVAGNHGAVKGMAIGAALGLLQNMGQNNAYQAQKRAQATTTRFSPWTHMTAEEPKVPNGLGSVTGYGAAGATMGQALEGGSMNPMAYMYRQPQVPVAGS